MKLATPLLTAAAAATVVGGGIAAEHARSNSPTLVTHRVAAPLTIAPVQTTAAAGGPTVTVVGTGDVFGVPDQGTMSFAVNVNAESAAAALSGEAADAQRLIDALKSAGVADKDVQTAYVSLYRNEQTDQFNASSSVSAVIHGISHIGPTIDAAVRAAGNNVSFGGISLSIGDTGSLMGSARAAAVHDAKTRAQQYAEAAGMKLGGIVSISESETAPRPIYYGGAPLAASAGSAQFQPVQPGQQQLTVSVTVVFALQ
ncbi:MAG TPA: SIMPL domain-containing protein [Candidatus Dormibacteraeota bacterium]